MSNLEKLAGYVIKLGIIAIVAALCWYFRSVLIYLIAAFVVSLVGHPLVRLMKKISIRGRSMPDWLLAILAIIIIIGGFSLIVTRVIPVVTGIIRDASLMNSSLMPEGSLIDSINDWVRGVFPSVGRDFNAVGLAIDKIKEVTSMADIGSVIGSVASAVAGVAVGLFSIVFIAFFFIKDEDLFRKIIAALTPDRLEESVGKAIRDIERLLSRYFVGLIIEMLGVALIDFLGLWLIARIGAGYAIGIAFIAGLLNVIPYLGPIIGEALGVVLCVILKYGAGVGLDVNIWVFALIVLAIMFTAQIVDNFLYQPLIYSASIQSTPLEIFIVILMAGHMGGALGMLVAIPAYTVIRVIAGRFFYSNKAVRRLMPDLENQE